MTDRDFPGRNILGKVVWCCAGLDVHNITTNHPDGVIDHAMEPSRNGRSNENNIDVLQSTFPKVPPTIPTHTAGVTTSTVPFTCSSIQTSNVPAPAVSLSPALQLPWRLGALRFTLGILLLPYWCRLRSPLPLLLAESDCIVRNLLGYLHQT